jgi:hypothetical protein
VNAAEEIKVRFSMREALEDVGWRRRGRGRYDCGLCEGSQTGTVACNDNKNVWHCKRCLQGGDQFTLIQLVHKCDFRSALEYLASRAGVRLEEPKNAAEAERLKREQEQRKQERQRLDAMCEAFAAEERHLRRECRDSLHRCDSVLDTPAPWSEDQWRLASIAHSLSTEVLLPEYTLLCFGAADATSRYVMAGDVERAWVLEEVRWSGGVRTDDGNFTEVIA